MTISPGTRIKELRMLFKMSQEELGMRVGVQRAAINKYETGVVTNIPIHTIEKMAYIFEVSPSYILGWDEIETESLSLESKVLDGVSKFYGRDVVNMIETYMEVNDDGKRRILEYTNDVWKLYHNANERKQT